MRKNVTFYRLKDEGDFFIECDRLINLSHWPKGPSSRNFSQFKCDHTISQCDTLLSNFTLKLAEFKKDYIEDVKMILTSKTGL